MDRETADLLQKLAKSTERSRAGVVRWLIKDKAKELFTKKEVKINE
jgi:hypothetical protein